MMIIMSEMIVEKLHFVYVWLCKIQSILDFKQWKEEEYPQYYTKLGLGRVGLISCILGIILGIHVTIAIVLLLYQYNIISITTSITSDDDDDDDTTTITLTLSFILLQWCCYVICLCIFHLLEFFISSIYNPLVVTSDTFLINHSISYTFAAIFSCFEFWLRNSILFFRYGLEPNTNFLFTKIMFYIGIIMVIISQIIRSTAMITCGVSFNHLIQYRKKDNHKLITHGIYSILRHPSYFGFYYWSIGMQCILSNIVSTILCIVASWLFFQRRIPYEETCLKEIFATTNNNSDNISKQQQKMKNPYTEYMKTTYIGIIPFIRSTTTNDSDDDDDDHSDNDDDKRRQEKEE